MSAITGQTITADTLQVNNLTLKQTTISEITSLLSPNVTDDQIATAKAVQDALTGLDQRLEAHIVNYIDNLDTQALQYLLWAKSGFMISGGRF